MSHEHPIRAARIASGLSQAQLSRLVGIPQHLISAWELGKREMPAHAGTVIRSALSEGAGALRATGRIPSRKRYRTSPSGNRGETLVPKPPSADELRTWLTDRVPTERYAASLTKALRLPDTCPLRGVAVFAGCGGMSLGMRAAGIRVTGYVEADPAARTTYRANFPEARELGTDIRLLDGVTSSSWPQNLDVLFGGPPCQGFSLTGKRSSGDPRNSLFESFASLAAIIRPACVVLENVRLIASMSTAKGEPMLEAVRRAFADAGYVGSAHVVKAQDFGVPQVRERVFFVATRKDLDTQVTMPASTHSANGDLLTAPYVTFRDATKDLPPLESAERSDDPFHWAVAHPKHVLAWLRDVPEGMSAHDNIDPALRPLSGYNTTYKRLRWDEPCSTIGTTFGMISGSRNVHPVHTRSLTVREAMRCQSFPDQFLLKGNWGDIRRLVGNAVPPLLARAVGQAVVGGLCGHSRELVEVSSH